MNSFCSDCAEDLSLGATDVVGTGTDRSRFPFDRPTDFLDLFTRVALYEASWQPYWARTLGTL